LFAFRDGHVVARSAQMPVITRLTIGQAFPNAWDRVFVSSNLSRLKKNLVYQVSLIQKPHKLSQPRWTQHFQVPENLY
jgi:hypothetical protein